MNKTAQTELHRRFLVEGLPEPLTPASAHLQVFDTYLPATRFRLRQMRDPMTNHWTRSLQQRFCMNEGEHAVTKSIEMHLDDDEFALFERMRGDETRKNRYFHEFDNVTVAFDVYLGALRGLTVSKVSFDALDMMAAYEPPPFMIFEVTEEASFEPRELARRSFDDVRNEVARLGASMPPETPEE